MTCICGEDLSAKRIAAIEKFALEPLCLRCADKGPRYRATQEFVPELMGRAGEAIGWHMELQHDNMHRPVAQGRPIERYFRKHPHETMPWGR